jgi:Mrp family chromosome partitioning ATPase
MIVGLLISVLIATINYLLHDKITSLFEISKYSSGTISILGMIPLMKNKIPISPLIVDKSPKSMITESFRAIRTNLQFITNDKDAKIIAISSTISGEGKTFLAINLAGIIAFTGKKSSDS